MGDRVERHSPTGEERVNFSRKAGEELSGRRVERLQQVEGAGAGDGLGAVGDAKFSKDAVDMFLHRAHRHRQTTGDLLIG